MAIHDIPVNLSHKQADPDGVQNGDLSAARLFQNNLQQHLAQVAAPPAPPLTPAGPGVTQPAPIFLNPSTTPGSAKPAPPALTPYTPPPLPVSPATDPATMLHSAGEKAQQLLHQLTRTLQSLTRPFSKTDLAAWNTALANISSTLRLQVISPAEQLAINQQADLNAQLNNHYAIGLQTPIDGNLALTGSLTELFRFFQTGNTQYFQPFHSRADGLSMKGLSQRHQYALEQLTDTRVLNAARGRLKSIEQVLKNHYPSLTLMAIADRSAESQNGFQINQASDRDNGQTYIIGLDLPVKMTDRSTRQIPASLAGSLQALGTFLVNGGYGWLTANGLHANRSTGVTLEGVVKRYALAQVNPADLGNGTPQTGSTLTQHLNTDVELPPANDPETTVNTSLPFGSENQTGISFKPGTNDEQDKNNNGLISIRASKPLQTPEPNNTQNNNGPIKASNTEQPGQAGPKSQGLNNTTENDQTQEVSANQTDISLETLNAVELLESAVNVGLMHFYAAHLDISPETSQNHSNLQKTRMLQGFFDILAELLVLDNRQIKPNPNSESRLPNETEKQIVAERILNQVAAKMLSTLAAYAPDTEPTESELKQALEGLNNYHLYVSSIRPRAELKLERAQEDSMETEVLDTITHQHTFRTLQLKLFTELYERYGPRDQDSAFQQLIKTVDQIMENTPHREIYAALYRIIKTSVKKTNDIIFSGNYLPNYDHIQDAIEAVYRQYIEIPVFGEPAAQYDHSRGLFQLLDSKRLEPSEHPEHLPFGDIYTHASTAIKSHLGHSEIKKTGRLIKVITEMLAHFHLLQQYQTRDNAYPDYATLSSTEITKIKNTLLNQAAGYINTNISYNELWQPTETELKNVTTYFKHFNDSAQYNIRLTQREQLLANRLIYQAIAKLSSSSKPQTGKLGFLVREVNEMDRKLQQPETAAAYIEAKAALAKVLDTTIKVRAEKGHTGLDTYYREHIRPLLFDTPSTTD